MDNHVYPNQKRYKEEVAAGDRWQPSPLIEELKTEGARRRSCGTCSCRIRKRGAGLTNLEYAPLCEIMGRVAWAPEVFNCSAPDTGNMETLERYGTRGAEGAVAGAAAGRRDPLVLRHDRAGASPRRTPPTSRAASERDGDSYVINGRKWWSSGAPDPRCKLFIFMGKTDPTQSRPPPPAVDDPGADATRRASRSLRRLPVFGFDDAPHGHAEVDVRERARAGRQHAAGRRPRLRDRAGPARAGPHPSLHARRSAWPKRALEKMCKRVQSRVAFGKPIAEQTVTLERIAEARIMIDQARLLVLNAADMMDTVGNKAARAEIAMIKVAAPNMLCQVIDWAIQAHGGAGVTRRFRPGRGLRAAPARMRIVDGPDEVHRNQIARLELRKHR